MRTRLGSSPSQTFTYYLDRVKFTQEFDSILYEAMRTWPAKVQQQSSSTSDFQLFFLSRFLSRALDLLSGLI